MQIIILAFGFIILFIWLVVITYLIYRSQQQYKILSYNGEKKKIFPIIEAIIKDIDLEKKEVQKIKEKILKLEKDSELHIQKIGLLRFNPFHDTGGDQSFILALIDAQDTGIVISGLYSRSGTRWYAKRVIKGKGIDYELSENEKKAIGLAKNSLKQLE